MADTFWLWYPGDFELYHAMKQNFSRVERGCGWPAFWKSEGWRHRVAFRRSFALERETTFCVFSKAIGYVQAGERKYPFGRQILCPPGEVAISIHAGSIESFPSVYVQGDIIRSDTGWTVEDYAAPPVPAGFSMYFTRPDQDPAVWEYSEREYQPVRTEAVEGGTLYEFETELTAVLRISVPAEQLREMTVYCGESRDEALDREHCYYSWNPDPETGKCPRCAVRFAFIPGSAVPLTAIHQYVDIPVRARFSCDDPLLNEIWAVAEHTFRLCSGIFFIDGVKRDKWIWSGDAYQSLFVNQYLLADPEIEQRTLTALRGNDPMTGHINTIVDYSLLWILGMKAHYDAYGDIAWLKQMFPKMVSLMDFCQARTEEHGFLTGREQDWTFIDWADLDKEGPVAGEQMLMAGCWNAMAELSELLGQESARYREQQKQLQENIGRYFWDEELGAYVDSYTSGRRHVTRQTNLLALLFSAADAEKRVSILKHVLENDAVAPITTPYFNFFAMDALARTGRLDPVMDHIRAYWGGMLERGAVTFWEQFDPAVTGTEQYDMYGDRFGKSLCHAWAASPIYLIGRYFVGLRQTDPSGGFVLQPRLEYFGRLDCTLPVCGSGGQVRIQWDGTTLKVRTDCDGGILRAGGETIPLNGGTEIRIRPGTT